RVVEAWWTQRSVPAPAVAVLAVGLLVAMVVTGRVRESGQLVKFTPAGVMPEQPAEIDKVEMAAGTERWVFERAGSGWRGRDGRPAPASLVTSLDFSIKFMHVSPPIRVVGREEGAPVGLHGFGLDPPGYTATLYRPGAPG